MRNRLALSLAVLEIFLATLIWELIPASDVADSIWSSISTGLVWALIHWMLDGYKISPLNLWPPVARSVLLTTLATLGLTSLLTLAFKWENSAWELAEVALALWVGTQILRLAFGFGLQWLLAKGVFKYPILLIESLDHPTDLNQMLQSEVRQVIRIGISDEAASISDLRKLISEQVDLQRVSVVLVDHHIPLDDRVFSELTVFFNHSNIEVIGTENPIANSTSYLHYWAHNVLPVKHFKEPRLEFPNSFFKGLADYLWALIGLILFAPLIAYIPLRLRLTGTKQVLVKQTAIGPNLKPFTFREFNVFKDGTDAVDISILRLTDRTAADERFTEYGKFLRRHAYEQLPIIFSVLTGKMNLIGPRPVVVNRADLSNISNQRRLFMKPGLTGLWVLEDSTHIRDEELMQLVYAQHWSLGMDFKILVLTVYRMIRGDVASRN